MGPSVRIEGGALVASTATGYAVVTLGLVRRTVTVDPRQRRIAIADTWGWFHRTLRTVGFEAVEAVCVTPRESGLFTWLPQQRMERRTVSLSLRDRPPVELWRFSVRGAWSNPTPLPDVLFWEEVLEAALTEGVGAGRAEGFAGAVAAAIGVPRVCEGAHYIGGA